MMGREIAKEVYDLDLGRIDRTTQQKERKYAIDCDVRDPHNQEGNEDALPKTQWIYWGSQKTLIKSMEKAKRMLTDQPRWAVRFVESRTGVVIAEFDSVEEFLKLV